MFANIRNSMMSPIGGVVCTLGSPPLQKGGEGGFALSAFSLSDPPSKFGAFNPANRRIFFVGGASPTKPSVHDDGIMTQLDDMKMRVHKAETAVELYRAFYALQDFLFRGGVKVNITEILNNLDVTNIVNLARKYIEERDNDAKDCVIHVLQCLMIRPGMISGNIAALEAMSELAKIDIEALGDKGLTQNFRYAKDTLPELSEKFPYIRLYWDIIKSADIVKPWEDRHKTLSDMELQCLFESMDCLGYCGNKTAEEFLPILEAELYARGIRFRRRTTK